MNEEQACIERRLAILEYQEEILKHDLRRVQDRLDFITGDEFFRKICKQRTPNKMKCEYCEERFTCWTE